jgi:O-antigen/teichoic acid export membrane protein
MSAPGAAADSRSYGRAAGLLTVAVGIAGLLTYGFFAVASHTLEPDQYGQIVVLWAIVFVLVSTLFRPVEQLLARALAELDERGSPRGHALRVAAMIQFGLALGFVGLALALRGPLESDLLEGQDLLFWVMLGALVAFSASFFLRGYLAGGRQFTLFAALVVVDGASRLAFALAAAIGIATGMDLIALGIAIAPALSLVVAPFAARRTARQRPSADTVSEPSDEARTAAPEIAAPVRAEPTPQLTLAHGGGFAAAVLVIMLSEQIFLNGGPLITRALEGSAAAGFIFNVLMVARAPVVLFQAVAASLLPHLARLRSRGGRGGEDAFRESVRLTVVVVLSLAGLAVVTVLAAGPQLMQLAFGDNFEYDRLGLAIVAAGMGLYLSAATFNQAALAQGQARRAAACWLACAALFVLWNLVPVLDVFRRVQLGYAGAAALLCALLYLLYRRPHPHPEDKLIPGSPQEIEAQLAAADEVT